VTERHCDKCHRPVHLATHAFTGARVPIVCSASYHPTAPGEWTIWTTPDQPRVDYTAPRLLLGNLRLKPDAHSWRGDVHECYGGEK
jgi:hypothetical protein